MMQKQHQSLRRLGSKRSNKNDFIAGRYVNLTYQNSKNSSLKDLLAPAINVIDEQSQIKKLEYEYFQNKKKLILNLGRSYNRLTLDKISKVKNELNKIKMNQDLSLKLRPSSISTNY